MRTGGGTPADFVANALVDAEFTNVFTQIPSALDVPEPIVASALGFVRDVRMEGEERGAFTAQVLVVRESAPDAEADAFACEAAIRRAQWERRRAVGEFRLCGVDTTAPAFRERDGSGRFVWGFDVIMTVVRTVG